MKRRYVPDDTHVHKVVARNSELSELYGVPTL